MDFRLFVDDVLLVACLLFIRDQTKWSRFCV